MRMVDGGWWMVEMLYSVKVDAELLQLFYGD
jgi:hypothetical protein